MVIYKRISEIEHKISAFRAKGLTIGFVPTMGALHNGHVSLVNKASAENDVTVVSIFVNPTQFSSPDDLKHYPRNTEKDIAILEENNTDILFMPEVDEMYPSSEIEKEKQEYNFGKLEEVMEGKFRAGHFKGVAQAVSKLFEIVKPDTAYFGEKDFQQLVVIRELVKQKNYPVTIIGCPTVREENGLAMSSRNERLTTDERIEAGKISKALFFIRDNRRQMTVDEAKAKAKTIIEANGIMQVEYLEIADEKTLQPVTDWNKESQSIRCFVALQLGKVRLIDNVPLNTTFAA
jgi:pantoate--beta-alanine ligase